ncbi:uncharacterized protein LOC141915024 isoform X8 [Tubulanus polymorphus]|uniref:uncharacterized protein LOC141915024 isoform X8 n=1 Tax=Tubulanus polymorphus TaxID=672921 RepID=UPI003DA493C8
MDTQSLAIGGAVFVISAVVIYLISVCGMRERTYEEVMAEQRRWQEAQIKKPTKTDKKDKVKKKIKKKEKAATKDEKGENKEESEEKEEKVEKIEEAPVLAKEEKMLEIEPDPEIIDSEAPPKQPKGKKSKKTKSILHNRSERSPSTDAVDVPETFHPKQMPKDELEIKYSHVSTSESDSSPAIRHRKGKKGKDKSGSSNNSQEVRHETKAEILAEAEVEEVIHVTESTYATAEAPPQMEAPVKEKRKNKKNEGLNVEEATDTNDLLNIIKNAPLTEMEVQTLIDILLAKGGRAEWNKKSQKTDPVYILKKQLEDKEKSLQEEQQLAMSANSRIKELRQELSQEKSRYSQIEKSSQEKIADQQKEIQALHSRMQQTHEQHRLEMSQVRGKMDGQMMGDGQAQIIQRLSEENKQLKEAAAKAQMNAMPAVDVASLQQQLKIVNTELSNNVMKLNTSENAKRSMEQKLHRYEEQIRSLDNTKKDSESVLTRKLNEVSEELRKSEARVGALKKDYDRANTSKDMAETEFANLKNKFQQLEHSSTDKSGQVKSMENQIKILEAKVQEATSQRQDLETRITVISKDIECRDQELKSVKEENTLLATQLQTTKERQSGEGQEAPSNQPTGAVNGHVTNEKDIPKVSVTEHEKIVGQKAEEVSKLESDLSAKIEEIKRLSDDLENQKKKNNALREKNWKAMDALSQAEKRAEESPKIQQQLEQKESDLNQLREHIQRLKRENNELSEQHRQTMLDLESVSSSHQQVTDMEQQLAKSKLDVDQLRQELENKHKENEEMSEKFQQLSAQLTSLTQSHDKVTDLQHDLAQAKSELVRLQLELETKTMQSDDITDQFQKLSSELDSLRTNELKSSELLNKTKAELDDVEKQLAVKNEENTELLGKFQGLTVDIGTMKERESEAFNELNRINTQLEMSQQQISASSLEKSELDAKYEKLLSEYNSVKSTSAVDNDSEQKIAQFEEKISQLEQVIASKSEENEELKEKHKKLMDELNVINSKEIDVNEIELKYQQAQTELACVKETIQAKSLENEELKDKNTNLARQLNSANENVQQQVEDALRGERETSSSTRADDSKKIRHKLQKIFPSISTDLQQDDEDEWWEEFETKAQEHINQYARRQSVQLEQELTQSQDAQGKLISQVQHYKSVLSDTESMLNKLQSSVESEEQKWQSKLTGTESELTKTREQFEKLTNELRKARGGGEEDLNDLDFAYRCVEKSLTHIVDEMEVKVQTLETDLATAEKEKESLQVELHESQEILSSVKLELEKLKESLASQEITKKRDTIRAERKLGELTAELEKEKKEKADLASQTSKLNSIVTTGQDALKAEQENVKQLQAQLDEKLKSEKKPEKKRDSLPKLSLFRSKAKDKDKDEKDIQKFANLSDWEIVDPSSTSGAGDQNGVSSDSQAKEIQELRNKLAEQEKQLEKEIANNKHLSQKLAVSAGAQKDDSGTSV